MCPMMDQTMWDDEEDEKPFYFFLPIFFTKKNLDANLFFKNTQLCGQSKTFAGSRWSIQNC